MPGNIKKYHEQVAEQLIKQLKVGTAPWQQPWRPGASSFLPMNPTTGKRYRGINSIMLLAQGYADNRWLTYKQALNIGAQVRKGERGTKIEYWKFTEEVKEKDSQGNEVKQNIRLESPKVFFATVFNAEQIDGLPQLEPPPACEWESAERAEAILMASGAKIRHLYQNSAFYTPSTDTITLPMKAQFPTAESYYCTALHELGHWTGHESRMARDIHNKFGSEAYAKEELRAEIASMMLGDELGIGFDPGQHASYVGHWIKVLENDPAELFRAAAAAEKIQSYVLDFEARGRSMALTTKQSNKKALAAELQVPFAMELSSGRSR